MSNRQFDILIAGVGGQGQVLASRLLAQAAIAGGLFVRTGETIGMSQRGGCVISNVRVGDAFGPAVPDGSADLLIGFELCETARNIHKLKKGGRVLLNTQMINPITVSLGFSPYDEEAMLAAILESDPDALRIDGLGLALKAGNLKAANVVLLGAACGAGLLPFADKDRMLAAVRELLPKKLHEINTRAFELGYQTTTGI